MPYCITSYKTSKLFTLHLEAILKVLTLTETALAPFNIYLPVMRILNTITTEKRLLKIHYEKQKKICEEKGLYSE